MENSYLSLLGSETTIRKHFTDHPTTDPGKDFVVEKGYRDQRAEPR